MSIERYTELSRPTHRFPALDSHPDGEFVRFSDHMDRIAELEAQIKELEARVTDQIRAIRNSADEESRWRRKADQAEARFTAFFDALTGDAAVQADAAARWLKVNDDDRAQSRHALKAARTAALEVVEEADKKRLPEGLTRKKEWVQRRELNPGDKVIVAVASGNPESGESTDMELEVVQNDEEAFQLTGYKGMQGRDDYRECPPYPHRAEQPFCRVAALEATKEEK